MLASITEGVPDALKQLGAEEGLPFLAENKYDGIRAQVRLCLYPNAETQGRQNRRWPTPLDKADVQCRPHLGWSHHSYSQGVAWLQPCLWLVGHSDALGT